MHDYGAIAKIFCDGLIPPNAALLPQDTCPICLNAYVSDTLEAGPDLQETLVETHCRHAFHHACLHRWLSMGKTSCPMCRVLFYTLPVAMASSDLLYDLADASDPFESTQLPLLWDELPQEQNQDSLLLARHTIWSEENRIVRALEQNGQLQRQRLLLIHELSSLVQEEEEHTLAELQYYRRIQGGENEQADWYRRDRLGSLRMQQDQIMPEFWALDQSLRQLVLEEQELRHAVHLEDLSPSPSSQD